MPDKVNPDNLPAVVVQGPTNLALDPTRAYPTWWTTLNPKDPVQRRWLQKALRESDFDADSIAGRVFSVSHVLTKLVSRVDPVSGEQTEWVRCVLIAPDGSSVAFASVGIVQSVADLIQFNGPPPWTPAVLVRLVITKTSAKFRYFSLEQVDEIEP